MQGSAVLPGWYRYWGMSAPLDSVRTGWDGGTDVATHD